MNIETVKKMPREPYKEIKAIAKEVAAEGIVMLENKDVLPFKSGTKVSVFGRNQTDYNKSGTGSGGLVNVNYVKSILECLEENENLFVNQQLKKVYADWIEENPFDIGSGWASEPWCQVEMPLSDDVVKSAAQDSDAAVVIISRTAGEDKDNKEEPGSYLLSFEEEDMIKKVCQSFDKVCLLLNVGNIIDMKFVEKYNIGAVLYIWQGGQYGAEVIPDILTGKISPSGKLADTIAYNISDYPAYKNFGDAKKVIYQEDIYVGYRYFETFEKDKVMYPFGYGKSYTDFNINCTDVKEINGKIALTINVTNIGDACGKEVVQVYYKSPNGKLGQPARQLVAFEKTNILQPNECEVVEISFDITDMKSYDDSGITGYKSAFVMESGDYEIYAGNSVRAAKSVYTYKNDKLNIIESLSEAYAPVEEFKRLKAEYKNGKIIKEYEAVPIRTIDLNKRIKDNMPDEVSYTGDKGIKLYDVYNGKNTLDEFVAQLTAEQMICLSRGEGMNSPKVPTPGTGSAFGGLTNDLRDMGIPIVCTTDGPSGLRLDGGDKATSIPNGTLIACTFNKKIVEKLYEMLAIELYVYDIDVLLGPGINIHRHPLNGRNFEYFSEDPYLSGIMAIMESKGIGIYNASVTLKHFCCNSQEFSRNFANAVVSERALREIYLKAFEMAVKTGYAKVIMTTYNPTNGLWTAGSYDLNTTILREQWGYDGIVMTDWYARINDEGEEGVITNTKAMIRAQNDLYMVVSDSLSNANKDNSLEAYKNGDITLAQLQRNTKNILKFIMNATVFKKYLDNGCVMNIESNLNFIGLESIISFENVKKYTDYTVNIEETGRYYIKVVYDITVKSVAQYIMKFNVNGREHTADTLCYSGESEIIAKKVLDVAEGGEFSFSISGNDLVEVKRVEVYK